MTTQRLSENLQIEADAAGGHGETFGREHASDLQKYAAETRALEDRADVLEKAFYASEELGRREAARAEAVARERDALQEIVNDVRRLCERAQGRSIAYIDNLVPASDILGILDAAQLNMDKR